MKKILYVTVAIAACLFSACSTLDNADFVPGPDGTIGGGSQSLAPDVIAPSELKVISFNVRTSTADKNQHAWDNRKAACVALLKKENPTVFGVQEARENQVSYLAAELPEYAWIGVGRDDGDKAGEFMAIFYKKSDVSLTVDNSGKERCGTFWLAEGGPTEPVKGWDAEYIRTATWAEFLHKGTGRMFFYINTHVDNVGVLAKEQSILLLCSKLGSLNPENHPAIITADFNSNTDDAIFNPLKQIMNNTRESSVVYDREATYNGWSSGGNLKLDHIFVSPSFTSKRYRTIRESYLGVDYVSDHYPISSLLEFK